jgi:sortase (surface protein transpeptidase)
VSARNYLRAATSGGRYLAVAAAAVILAGIAMLVLAFQHSGPPQPPLATGADTSASQSGTANGPAKIQGPVLPHSVPVRLDIPKIGVHTKLLSLGLAGDGTAAVPSLEEAQLASWYNLGPTPGQPGPAVLLGHVDTKTGPAVFYSIGSLVKGDTIEVTRQDGKTAVFSVDKTERYPKVHFPTNKVFGDLNYSGIRLITCGGDFDSSTGHYVDNVIVFGHLLNSKP